MTIREIAEKYSKDNDGYIYCSDCPLNGLDKHCPKNCRGRFDAYGAIQQYFEEWGEISEDANNVVNDMVNHPAHYCREGGMESIDEMVLLFGKEAVKHFCLCNVWKYRYRAADKNGIEDLKKSDWYMRKYKELCSNE